VKLDLQRMPVPKNPVKPKNGKNNDGKKTQLQYGIPSNKQTNNDVRAWVVKALC
jgi:hypothetical protein